jgi:hypothetical protein
MQINALNNGITLKERESETQSVTIIYKSQENYFCFLKD